MTIAFVTEYVIPERARDLGYGKEYYLKFRHLVLHLPLSLGCKEFVVNKNMLCLLALLRIIFYSECSIYFLLLHRYYHLINISAAISAGRF